MKRITVFLTNDDLYGFIEAQDEMPKISYTWETFNVAIACEDEKIYTTLLDAVSPKYYELGYDIIVISEGKYMRFSDLVRGGFHGRDIRTTQNWQKMLKSGVFSPDIRAEWKFYTSVPGVVMKK